MINTDKRKAVFLLHQEGIGRNQIARQLQISPNTVRVIIEQQGEMPQHARSDKIHIDSDLLKRVYEECEGFAQRVHKKLVEEEHVAVKYSTLTQILRQLGLRRSGERRCRAAVAVREWLLDLINGKRAVESLHVEIPDADVQFLYFHLKHGRSRQRKKAATILARKRGIPNSVIAKAIQSASSTTRRYYRIYVEAGLEALFAWNTNRHYIDPRKVSERTKRILELLHHKPSSCGINRANWTQAALRKAYEHAYGEVISRSAIAKIIRGAGYRWKKARRVLSSPDPCYHEKVELLLRTLQSLGAGEMFFFLDEWGPVQVRKRDGKAYRTDHAAVPRHQVSRGNVSLIAALSATTNQVTWHFLESKDSHAMMDMIEILYNQYHTKTRLYVTWDAVAWHNSGPLLEALDHFNEETRAVSVGPIIELVPLPVSSQFLNVVEGVLSGMTRAVINNSDYADAMEMKQAISRHFSERNEYFKQNPRRVGKKIWEFDFFQHFDALRGGNYKRW
jgi:transposase